MPDGVVPCAMTQLGKGLQSTYSDRKRASRHKRQTHSRGRLPTQRKHQNLHAPRDLPLPSSLSSLPFSSRTRSALSTSHTSLSPPPLSDPSNPKPARSQKPDRRISPLLVSAGGCPPNQYRHQPSSRSWMPKRTDIFWSERNVGEKRGSYVASCYGHVASTSR